MQRRSKFNKMNEFPKWPNKKKKIQEYFATSWRRIQLKERQFSVFIFKLTWRNPVHRPSSCCSAAIDFLFWCHDSDDYCSSDCCCCCCFVGLCFQRCSGNVQELNCVFRLLAWDSMSQRVLSTWTQPWCWDLCTEYRPCTLNTVTWIYHMLISN